MNFLHLSDLSIEEIEAIFRMGDKLRTEDGGQYFKGKCFALFSPESSLRTRVTFEKGIKELGGECILFPPETLDKKEDLTDVMGYLENWIDGVIIRHPKLHKMTEMSKHARIPIINAMSSENHPCEILSDIYSVRQLRPDFKELKYVFVGPAGNILKSWVEIANVLDLDFHHVCTANHQMSREDKNYSFTTDLEAALVHADVVLTDSLPQELQNDEYYSKYQVNKQRMQWAKPNALLNPCPPFFRNQEVSEDVIDSDYFVGYAFKKNLLYVQQAVLINCLQIQM